MFYVLCDKNCKYESMTKEQILTAIEQAVNDGKITNVDTGFVTSLKEKNANKALTFWVGTTAEYNAILTKVENCFYILTDDTMAEDINREFVMLKAEQETIVQQVDTAIKNMQQQYETDKNKKNKLLYQTADNNAEASYENLIEIDGLGDYQIFKISLCDDNDSNGYVYDVLAQIQNMNGDTTGNYAEITGSYNDIWKTDVQIWSAKLRIRKYDGRYFLCNNFSRRCNLSITGGTEQSERYVSVRAIVGVV